MPATTDTNNITSKPVIFFDETTQIKTQIAESTSDRLKLSISNTGDENAFVRFQVFLSRNIEMLTSITKQRTNNSRTKRQVEKELNNFPSAYNGNNFAPNEVQMTSTAISVLSNHYLSNEVEFTNSKYTSSLIKTNNEVLTIIELPPNEQVSATIFTPNYPLTYPSDSNVAFFIRTSGAYSLELEFADFDVETSFDSVFIIKVDRNTNERTFIAFPSKNDNSFVYNSNGKDLLIVLKTDCTGESRGFSGTVKVVTLTEPISSSTIKPLTNRPSLPTTTISNENLPETKQCGDLELVGNGIIRSPGWPDYYPVDSSCSYLVSARFNRSVDLEINILAVRLDYQYMRDHIIIYLGNSDKHPILTVLNGYNQSHHFVTNTSQVLIKFKSYADSFFNHGFSITYKETNDAPLNLPSCGGIVKQNSRIYFPNYANYKSILCEWRLQANVNEKAKAVVYINNTPYYTYASGTGVQIYNGPNTSSKNIGYLYRTNFNKNVTYVSDNEYLFLRYIVSGFYSHESNFGESSSSYFDFFEN